MKSVEVLSRSRPRNVGATCRPCCAGAPLPLEWGGPRAISRRTLIAQLIFRHFDCRACQGEATTVWFGVSRVGTAASAERGHLMLHGEGEKQHYPLPSGSRGHAHHSFGRRLAQRQSNARPRKLNVTGKTRRGAILSIVGDCDGGIGWCPRCLKLGSEAARFPDPLDGAGRPRNSESRSGRERGSGGQLVVLLCGVM